MYYISIFVDNYQSFIKKIRSISPDIWIYSNQEEKQLELFEIPPEHSGYWYLQTWYLYGGKNSSFSIDDIPQIPLYDGSQYNSSFPEIDESLYWLSVNYSWCIIPWGGPKSFLSFAFITKSDYLHGQFTKLISAELTSSYQVQQNFSECAIAILLSGYDRPAHRLWDICQCDIVPLWLITDLLFDEETFSVFSSEIPQFKFISSLFLENSVNRILSVYHICNKSSFEIICHLRHQDPYTFIFLPETIDLNVISKLLSKTEDYYNYSDLLYLQSIIVASPWFYGLDRDRTDYGISLFVSRNNNLLMKFNEIKCDDDYQLLSCF